MNLSKTTIDMFKRRGVAIVDTAYEVEMGADVVNVPVLEFCGIGSDGEPTDEYVACYRVTNDGLSFDGSCFPESQLTEEFPAWIYDEKNLRRFADEFAEIVRQTY